MSDSASTPPPEAPDAGANASWGLIIIVVLAVAAIVVAAVLLLGDGDESDSDTTTAPSETTAPATTQAPETTAPATTQAPETTAPATTAPATTAAPPGLEFAVADIDDGGTIPTEFTCDGDNTSPVVTVTSIPDGVVQLAFIVDDPDAPRDDPFVHWVVYGIPGDATEITDGDDAMTYGVNDAGTEEWFGPCPPEGDGAHEYRFTLYALDRDLGLESALDGRQVADAIADATLVETGIAATYERAAG